MVKRSELRKENEYEIGNVQKKGKESSSCTAVLTSTVMCVRLIPLPQWHFAQCALYRCCCIAPVSLFASLSFSFYYILLFSLLILSSFTIVLSFHFSSSSIFAFLFIQISLFCFHQYEGTSVSLFTFHLNIQKKNFRYKKREFARKLGSLKWEESEVGMKTLNCLQQRIYE